MPENSDTATSDTVRQPNPVAKAALLVGLYVVVVGTFTLSFAGLYDYGNNLSQLPLILPAFVPVVIEGLTICAVGAIYILRHAPFRIRIFSWAVFVVPVSLSVAGNMSHALSRHLPTVAVAGSAAWPIILALATHLVVVTIRYTERVAPMSQPKPVSRHVVSPATSNIATPVVGIDSDNHATATQQPVATADTGNSATTESVRQRHATRKPVATPSDKDREYARRRAAEGATASDIHMELVANGSDINKRTIERWTKQVRDTLQGATQ